MVPMGNTRPSLLTPLTFLLNLTFSRRHLIQTTLDSLRPKVTREMPQIKSLLDSQPWPKCT